MDVVEIADTRAAPVPVLEEVHRLKGLVHSLLAPEDPPETVSRMRGWFHHPPADEHRSLWLARDGRGRVPGVAWVSRMPSGLARTDILVDPRRRREGIGSALFEALLDAVRRDGVRGLVGSLSDDESLSFARHRRARVGRTTVRQVLTPVLLAVDGPEAGGGHSTDSDVERLCWIGAAPDLLLDSYARARMAINDAPMDADEAEEWTASRVRQLEETMRHRGIEQYVCALVAERTKILAFTEIRVSRERSAVASTEDTAVVPSWRGRGLAGMVKRASLEQLASCRPDVRAVVTSNDAENTAMLAVNRRLGFRPVRTLTTVRLALGAPSADSQ